jgi:hypothetical protein
MPARESRGTFGEEVEYRESPRKAAPAEFVERTHKRNGPRGCYFTEADMLTDEQKWLIDKCIYKTGDRGMFNAIQGALNQPERP